MYILYRFKNGSKWLIFKNTYAAHLIYFKVKLRNDLSSNFSVLMILQKVGTFCIKSPFIRLSFRTVEASHLRIFCTSTIENIGWQFTNSIWVKEPVLSTTYT